MSETARKEMQDAVNGTGLNGHVKIYFQEREKMQRDEDHAWSSR